MFLTSNVLKVNIVCGMYNNVKWFVFNLMIKRFGLKDHNILIFIAIVLLCVTFWFPISSCLTTTTFISVTNYFCAEEDFRTVLTYLAYLHTRENNVK